jgi:hypothetical protein
MTFERHSRHFKGDRGPAEVARRERDFCLSHQASRTGHCLFRAEGARCTTHESFRSIKIAELRHCDAAKREGRGIVTQGDTVQCGDGITCRECVGRSFDQRVHENPATVVTPII